VIRCRIQPLRVATRDSAGMIGFGPRPGRRLSRAFARGGTDGRGRRHRATGLGRLSCTRLSVTARRYAVCGTAESRSVQMVRPTVQAIVPPCKIIGMGRTCLVRCRRCTLEADLARRKQWHLSGEMGTRWCVFGDQSLSWPRRTMVSPLHGRILAIL
jgi:hypothetical protein